jgi:hypothetical protein
MPRRQLSSYERKYWDTIENCWMYYLYSTGGTFHYCNMQLGLTGVSCTYRVRSARTMRRHLSRKHAVYAE